MTATVLPSSGLMLSEAVRNNPFPSNASSPARMSNTRNGEGDASTSVFRSPLALRYVSSAIIAACLRAVGPSVSTRCGDIVSQNAGCWMLRSASQLRKSLNSMVR